MQTVIDKKAKSNIELFVIGKVRDKRRALAMSQEDVASILDTARGFIGQVESPNYSAKYNLNHLNKLALEFGCSLYEFFPEKPLLENQPKKGNRNELYRVSKMSLFSQNRF